MLFTSYHYIKARSHAREIQNTTIFNPYEMEQLDVKIYDHQSLDHTINLGHMSYQFSDIYLNDNQEVYLIYKFEKLDPYIYDSVQYSIDTCNDKQCFYDSRIHFDHYNKDIGFSKTAYLKFDASEIPTTLVLKYQHTLLDEVQKIFEIEIRENYE